MDRENRSRRDKRPRHHSSQEEADLDRPVEADEFNESIEIDILDAGLGVQDQARAGPAHSLQTSDIDISTLAFPEIPQSGLDIFNEVQAREINERVGMGMVESGLHADECPSELLQPCGSDISSHPNLTKLLPTSTSSSRPFSMTGAASSCSIQQELNPYVIPDFGCKEVLVSNIPENLPCCPVDISEPLIQSSGNFPPLESATARDVLPVGGPENLPNSGELGFCTMSEGVPLTDYPTLFEPIPETDDEPVMSTDYSEAACDPTHIDMELDDEDISTDQYRGPDKNSPIYPGAQVNLLESFLATLTFIESEHISGAGLGRLLKLISLHLPQDSNYFKSTHQFFKLLDSYEEPVRVHYYCSVCYKYRSSSTDLCDTCTDPMRSVIFFLSFSLISQIAKLYSRPNFLDYIQHKNSRVKQNQNGIEDVYDGNLYKEAQKSVLASPFNISLLWNTDGLQLFNSSSFSLWAWYFVINELPPDKRFQSENMLVAGIWGSVKKPHPNVFLQPIHDELESLRKGVNFHVHGIEQQLEVKVIVLCGTCDAPAVAMFLNIKSHSGFYSCHICYCRGEKSKRTGDVTVFPYQEDFPLRCKADYINQVKYAVENRVLHNTALLNEPECSGIKGPTTLSYFVSDIFTSTAIDSMHALYLGVTRQILTLLFDHAYRNEKFSVHSKIKEFNERMSMIRPPHFVQRHPQGVDKLAYWKATEFRSFLFYYSLFVLCGILPKDYFDNFLLFVEGVALLNSGSITPEDIVLAEMLLDKFVRDFETLYGLRHMSHNIHMVLHLGSCVRNLGPLFISSCFKFEDMNGRVLNFVHGSRHAALQIHSKLNIIKDLPLKIHNMNEGPAKTYCKKLKQKWMILKINCKISDGLLCVGLDFQLDNDKSWVLNELVTSRIIMHPNVLSVRVYHRLMKGKLLYVSRSYGRGHCDSSFAKYCVNGVMLYGRIEFFIKVK
ncbi:hypothetical protein FOCC_FOCC015662, partial [Frankliniella occidentalis]